MKREDMAKSRSIKMFTILFVDDEQSAHSSLNRFFAKYNYTMVSALEANEALAYLETNSPDLVILDLKMPGMDGLTLLKKIKETHADLKVIIQTGHGGVNEAVEALKHGASDFLEKGSSPEILRTRVNQVYELWLLEQQNRELKESSPQHFHFPGLIGESIKIQKLKDMIVRVAPTETTVLIQGESGTGKELVARAIHHHSHRMKKEFIPVDCAAISESVIESELFGHTKGAYTGADSASLGLIRSADQGTLFLDEIGELSPAVQAKLLRTIQERIVRPVGSTKSYPVDMRIVAATNRTLLSEVSEGKFRQDLYYRLSSVTLTSPSLQEREGDIELLAQHILERNAKEGEKITISPRAMSKLRAYSWPGNIRELENVIKGASVFAEGNTIDTGDLPSMVSGAAETVSETDTPAGTLASYELRAIKNALQRADGNRRKAAEILDISEATLYRKIKQFKL